MYNCLFNFLNQTGVIKIYLQSATHKQLMYSSATWKILLNKMITKRNFVSLLLELFTLHPDISFEYVNGFILCTVNYCGKMRSIWWFMGNGIHGKLNETTNIYHEIR